MFNTGMASPSLADIAAVTKNNDGNGMNDGFGFGGGWWVIIILLFLFGGFNGGWNNGNNCSNDRGETTIISMPPVGGGYGGMGYGYGLTEGTLQRGFDTQTIINKLDGLNSGVCGLGYDQLAQMNGINSNIMQSSFGLQQSINNSDVNRMQDMNALSRQLGDCCCENRAGQADIKYTMATDTCQINTNVHQTGDAIIQNQNNGFQMLNQTIKDGFCELKMSQKDQRIAELEQRLNDCSRDNALQSMANYVVNRLDPPASPSYIVSNPNGCSTLQVSVQDNNNCGCGRSTGCCGNGYVA